MKAFVRRRDSMVLGVCLLVLASACGDDGGIMLGSETLIGRCEQLSKALG